MAENSAIEWCSHTFNPWRGCTKVSAGCAHCYAEALSGRNPGTLGVWGPNGTRVVAAESYWRQPLKWDKAAKATGERHRVFCASLADVFEDWTGPMRLSGGVAFEAEACVCHGCGEWMLYTQAECGCRSERLPRRLTMGDVRRRLFDLIDQTPSLGWLLLTKRPENVTRMTFDPWCKKVPGHVSQNEGDGRRWQWPSNVWLGTSVENQAAADERIPHLLATPAAVRFLSCEPLLGPVRIPESYLDGTSGYVRCADEGVVGERIHWVIAGGESGPGARPCRVAWLRSLREQCAAAGVAYFCKQLGSNPEGDDIPPPARDPDTGTTTLTVRQVLAVRDRKGGDIDEFPADLRVREFPASTRW